MVTQGWIFWWYLCIAAKAEMFRSPRCSPEMLLGEWEVGTCLPVEKGILPGGSPCERFVPRSPVCGSPILQSLAWQLQTPLYGPFGKSVRGFFFPSAENLVQNSIPLLSKNLSIFSEVYLRAVYAQGSSKLKENKWGGNSLKIQSQALSYHIESKWS